MTRSSAVFKRSSTIDAGLLDELEETLVGTDIGVRTAYALFESIQEKAPSLNGPDSALDAIRDGGRSDSLRTRIPACQSPQGLKPYVIMVTGVNGSGKTTTIAKIAHHLKNDGKIGHHRLRGHLQGRGHRTAGALGQQGRC
ncbi:MAG: signal recognition particle receptor subunit alpha [Marinilabiliales bacterium]|nr:signal recognition particle receptor subunit alpha [Marinilabiliales bacterium]